MDTGRCHWGRFQWGMESFAQCQGSSRGDAFFGDEGAESVISQIELMGKALEKSYITRLRVSYGAVDVALET